MNHRCRSGHHIIRDHRDRRPNGACAACARNNEAEYRRKLRQARQLVADMGLAI